MIDDLVLTRTFRAPRQLMWQVWTDPVHLARWWGPAGFTTKVARCDLKPGGIFLYSQTPPGAAQPLWGKFVYDEVLPIERLVFRSSFSDAEGSTLPNPWNPQWPLQISNVLTLTEEGGQTTVNLRGRPYQASAEGEKTFDENKGNVTQGFKGTFDQLEAYLTSLA